MMVLVNRAASSDQSQLSLVWLQTSILAARIHYISLALKCTGIHPVITDVHFKKLFVSVESEYGVTLSELCLKILILIPLKKKKMLLLSSLIP